MLSTVSPAHINPEGFQITNIEKGKLKIIKHHDNHCYRRDPLVESKVNGQVCRERYDLHNSLF